MKIKELIDNREFSFNVPFRIYEYIPPDSEDEGEVDLKYDSETDMELDYELYDKWISAINHGDDGAVEIEYLELV